MTEQARARMVRKQLAARGIRDERVLEAMRRVPREAFVPQSMREQAYEDRPLPIGDSQTISQPYTVAAMTEMLRLEGFERVLEVGTGSGYQAAVLSRIAGEIYSIERFRELSERAASVFENLGYTNIHLRVGDGTEGWEEEAPFDAIIVTAGAPGLPRPLYAQLRVGGRLLVPIGERFGQVMTRFTKTAAGPTHELLGNYAFVPLVGEHGWEQG